MYLTHKHHNRCCCSFFQNIKTTNRCFRNLFIRNKDLLLFMTLIFILMQRYCFVRKSLLSYVLCIAVSQIVCECVPRQHRSCTCGASGSSRQSEGQRWLVHLMEISDQVIKYSLHFLCPNNYKLALLLTKVFPYGFHVFEWCTSRSVE